jgi:hypothetical protein
MVQFLDIFDERVFCVMEMDFVVEELDQLVHVVLVLDHEIYVPVLTLEGDALPRVKWNLFLNKLEVM